MTLGLASMTEASWTKRALADLEEILVDHAHCEKKAASTALSLVFKYMEHSHFLPVLSALAREELRHFEQVLQHLAARDIPFRRQKPSPYAGRLMEACRKDEPDRLLDVLIVCSLIEARSLERMGILRDAVDDPELSRFYGNLLASEARHRAAYLDLARSVFPSEVVAHRHGELARHEARVIAEAPPWPRMHC
ncbi:MAG TPA: tRNA-(ms[2]io[6]A)-hydroxylase [Planctomycetes bacterium]|nr:tRNA-(ms[2]io[6]A)-hydroxylase [Planctomycetota bacterium]